MSENEVLDPAQLVKDYVTAVNAYEDSNSDEAYAKCEDIWMKMVHFALGAQ